MKLLSLPGIVAAFLLVLAALPGCFDPLYEDFGPPVGPVRQEVPQGAFILCCEDNVAATCECLDAPGCEQPLLKACGPRGVCAAPGQSCPSGSADAGSVLDAGTADAGTPPADSGVSIGLDGGSVDAGTTPADAGVISNQDAGADAGTSSDAGFADAGTSSDAGTSADAGFADAGTPDAGSFLDAGFPSQDAGSSAQDAGTAAPEPTEYEFCCNSNGQVDTCACPATGCLFRPFTACSGNRCVAGHGSSCP